MHGETAEAQFLHIENLHIKPLRISLIGLFGAPEPLQKLMIGLIVRLHLHGSLHMVNRLDRIAKATVGKGA